MAVTFVASWSKSSATAREHYRIDNLAQMRIRLDEQPSLLRMQRPKIRGRLGAIMSVIEVISNLKDNTARSSIYRTG